MKQAIFKMLARQFARPRGALGHLAGWVMANRPSNVARTKMTIEGLDLGGNDHVLEVGCGPGLGLELLSQRITAGRIVGVDHSGIMVQMAKRRIARTRTNCEVNVVQSDIESLTERDSSFDKIVGINVHMFWPNPLKNLEILHRLTRVNGVLALTFQPRKPGANRSDTDQAAERLVGQLNQAGFGRVQTRFLLLQPVDAVCVTGTRLA